MNNIEKYDECLDEDHALNLEAIDPTQIDNQVLRKALERVRERTQAEPHCGHFTKHSSHTSHSKGGW